MIIKLTPEQAEFLLAGCQENIRRLQDLIGDDPRVTKYQPMLYREIWGWQALLRKLT